MKRLSCLFALVLTSAQLTAEPLVYDGESGIGKGKHLVFIASDHEYRSEETLPAMARLLAKHHGFKCTVLFGLHSDGRIRPGYSNVPGMEALEDADLLVLFTRFQDWSDEQMKHFAAYIDRAGPIVGLRTATHAFRIKDRRSPWLKYNNGFHPPIRNVDKALGLDVFEGGFGRWALGEKWAGHHGSNHKMSTRLDNVIESKDHPVLRGVGSMWATCGGYKAAPIAGSEILALAQPLTGMQPDSPAEESMAPMPAAWTRSYKNRDGAEGRVFTCLYGASSDLTNDGLRRMLINGCLWATGLEHNITADLDVSLVGPYHPTWMTGSKKRKAQLWPKDMAGWDSPIPPLAE